MAFSINTNVASLQAQNYLQQNSNFQAKTIGEVTSGLRIVNSGDDAAGLAVANGYRSDEAVLTQGIQNANNGLSTLQTIDSGMSNISTLLDRARTLATESASGTFTGDRGTVNSEFQSVISEITRQATSIGMNQSGQFAQALSVFVGGGKGATSAAANANGTINLDLTKSAVDAQSLGLQGVQAIGTAGTDIGSSSATSVSNILANTTNTASEATAGYTSFSLSGPGFSGANKINISVNLAGVTDANSLATNINNAIQAAGVGSTQYATALKNAGISASLNTDASGNTQLTFSSGTTAFQVQAGDKVANAFLGNFSSGSTGAAVATTTVTGTGNVANQQTVVGTALAATTTITTGTNDQLKLNVGATNATLTLAGGTYSADQLVSQINTQIAGSGLNNHVSASLNSSNQLVFTESAGDATAGNALSVSAPATHNAAAALGYSTGTTTASTNPTVSSSDQVTLQFNGGGLAGPVNIQLNPFTAGTTTVANVLSNLSSQVSQNAQLVAAGIKLTTDTSGSALVFSNASGQSFSVNATGDTTNVLGLGQFLTSTASTNGYDYSKIQAASNYVQSNPSGTASLGISLNGGANQVISANLAGGDATAASTVGTAVLTDAGVQALSGTAGKGLSVKVDGTQYDVDLSAINGSGTVAGTLTAINAALTTHGSATLDTAGHLVITSASKGSNSSVEILGNGVGDSTTANLAALGVSAGVTAGSNASAANVVQQLNSAIANSTTLSQAGLQAVNNGGSIQLTSTNGTNFRLDAYGSDIGFGSSGAAFGGNTATAAPTSSPYFDAQGATATSTLAFNPVLYAGGQQTLSFSANDSSGGAHTTSIALTNSSAASLDQALTTINSALQASNDSTLQQVVAVKEDTATQQLSSSSALSASTTITAGSNDQLKLTVGSTTASLTLTAGSYTPSDIANQINKQIAGSSLNGQVTASVDGNNKLVLTAVNPTQSVTVVAPASHDAATTLNLTDGQTSTAVGQQGIKFVSNLSNFKVGVGAVGSLPGTQGIGNAATQGAVVSGATVGTGGTASISTIAGAAAAVNALATAVQKLGSAQAVVGKGENLLNYATSLAQSQDTNEAASESAIRDANLAQQAANLTKAQILVQAGTAALAQANSAPQQLLSLLQGH